MSIWRLMLVARNGLSPMIVSRTLFRASALADSVEASSCESDMCNLYSITTNQAAIAALFRVINRYVGNLAPMPGVFPDYPAPVIRNTETGDAK